MTPPTPTPAPTPRPLTLAELHDVGDLLELLESNGFHRFEGAPDSKGRVYWLFSCRFGGGWLALDARQVDVHLVEAVARLQVYLSAQGAP